MTPTTRRQSGLMSVGEANSAVYDDEVVNITIDEASRREDDEDDSIATPRAYAKLLERGISANEVGEIRPPESTPTLKERTLSVEMIEDLHRTDEAEQLLTPSSIKDNDQDVDSSSSFSSSSDNDRDESTIHTPTPTIQALHRPTSSDIETFSSASSSSSSSSQETKQHSGDLEIIIPDSPTQSKSDPKTLTTSTPLSTPPTSASPSPSRPLTLRNTRFPTTTSHLALRLRLSAKNPWTIDYICYECEQPVHVRGGGDGIYDPASGANTDKMRCRECGCRMLWKTRTGRIVQFEAR